MTRRAGWIAAAAVALPALAYLAWKALFDRSDTVDFKYIWLAGHLWSQGIDAYGPDFRATGEALFVGLNPPQTLFYPPNLWPVATAVAALPYAEAIPVWRALNGAALVASVLIVAQAVRGVLGPGGPLRPALAVAFAGAGTGAAVALSLGQTSPLILFGLALFVSLWLRQDRWTMVLALAILAMKPNYGVALAAFLLFDRRWWPSLAGGAAATLACAAPVFWTHGIVTVITEYLANVGQFGDHWANRPYSSTGLRNLLDLAFGWDLSPLTMVAVGVALLGALGALDRGRMAPDGAQDPAPLCLAVCVAFFVAPMHTYDAVLLAPVILLCRALPVLSQAVVGLALLAILREANLAQVLPAFGSGAENFPGTRIVSVATALAVLACALRGHAQRR